jgi:hypothetical protein
MAFVTNAPALTDPATGIPIPQGVTLVTEDGVQLMPQMVGQSPGSQYQEPGNQVPTPVGQTITYPYGFSSFPVTGPLS